MTQTGGLVILYAWCIFGALLAVLAYFLLRHEQEPLDDLSRPTADRNAVSQAVTSPPADGKDPS